MEALEGPEKQRQSREGNEEAIGHRGMKAYQRQSGNEGRVIRGNDSLVGFVGRGRATRTRSEANQRCPIDSRFELCGEAGRRL